MPAAPHPPDTGHRTPGRRRNPRRQALWIEKQNIGASSASSKTGGHHAVALFHDSASSGTKTKKRGPHGSRSSFPGRRRPPYSLLRRTPATSAPIRSPAAQTGFSPACTRGTSPASAAPSSGLSEKPLRLECPGGSFGQAHRPEAPTAAVQNMQNMQAAQTRTNRAIQNPHTRCRPQKPRASGRPAPASGQTAPQRPRRDGSGYSCSGSATRMRPQYSQMMIFLP